MTRTCGSLSRLKHTQLTMGQSQPPHQVQTNRGHVLVNTKFEECLKKYWVANMLEKTYVDEHVNGTSWWKISQGTHLLTPSHRTIQN